MHKNALQSERKASYKNERRFSVQVTQVGPTNFLSPDEFALGDYPPKSSFVVSQEPAASFPSTLSPTRPFATDHRSHVSVTTAPWTPGAGHWRSFRPPRLQLFLAHEQRQFPRLTQPGSVFGHFHEKGRVARLRWDVPRCPSAFPGRARIFRILPVVEPDHASYEASEERVRYI